MEFPSTAPTHPPPDADRRRSPIPGRTISTSTATAFLTTIGFLPIPGACSSLPAESGSNATAPVPSHPVYHEIPIARGAGTLLGDPGKVRTRLDDAGLDLGFDYVAEVLGNVAGGMDQGAIVEGLFWLNLDFDFAKAGLWDGTAVHSSVLLPHGDSLTRKYVGDLFAISNIDARDALVLFELWLEHRFADSGIGLRAGQLAADQEFAVAEYGTLFINSTCGWPGLLAVDGTAPAYPYGALGVRLAWTPDERFTVRAAVFDGSPNSVDDEGHPDNEHGIEYRFGDGALTIVEFEFGWNRSPDSSGLPGVAKAGGWYHTGDFSSMRYDRTGLPLADPGSTGIPAALAGNGGAYLIAEQQIFTESDHRPESENEPPQGLGVFARTAFAPDDRNLVSLYFEGGLHYRGLIQGRDADRLGIACAYGRIGDDARGLAEDRQAAGTSTDPVPDHELILEAGYQFKIRDGWTVQPGIHFIQHPGGSSAIDDALVLSLRTTLCF